MIKHTLDSPVRRNSDKLGGHYPARTVLGVWQQLVERYPRLGTDTGQQVVSDRDAHFPDDVGRPVGRYLFNQVRGSLAWQVGDDGGTVSELRLIEDLNRQRFWKGLQDGGHEA